MKADPSFLHDCLRLLLGSNIVAMRATEQARGAVVAQRADVPIRSDASEHDRRGRPHFE